MSSNWERSTLGEVVSIEIGRTPSRSDPTMWDPARQSGAVWVSIADLTACEGRVISDSKEYISSLATVAGKPVRAGTLMMSFKLSIGKLAFAGTDLYTNEAIAALTVKHPERLSPDFLFHYLSHVDWVSLSAGNEKVKGATLNKAKLAVVPVPVPPLAEQQRIVAKLDVAINIVSGLEQVTFERRRLFGEFARSWLAGALERTGGKVEKLGDIASVDYGERVVRARDGGTRYPVYGGGGATFSVDRSNRRDCFIISRFGMSEKCVRYVEGEFFLNDSGLSVSTRDEESLRQAFLDRVLLARQAEIYSLGAGTAQRNLDINKFKQMQLTVPPVKVQDKIVAEYDAVSGVCDTAEQSYSHRTGSFRSLRQSVLAAAFRGDL